MLWAEQQYEIRRVKRDLVHDKREEERAYREARYDDENWTRQWYLVCRFLHNLLSLFRRTINSRRSCKIINFVRYVRTWSSDDALRKWNYSPDADAKLHLNFHYLKIFAVVQWHTSWDNCECILLAEGGISLKIFGIRSSTQRFAVGIFGTLTLYSAKVINYTCSTTSTNMKLVL